MKYFFAGGLIWFKTIFLNATLFGTGAMLMNDWHAFYSSFIVFIGSFIFTMPLLLIIIPLVKLSTKIPYRVQARIAWLTFNLMLLIITFYAVFLFDDSAIDSVIPGLLSTSLTGLLVAVYTTRKRLTKLNESQNINQEI